MVQQLSMLQQDSSNLAMYINEVRSKGKTDLVSKLEKKLSFLNNKIATMENLAA